MNSESGASRSTRVEFCNRARARGLAGARLAGGTLAGLALGLPALAGGSGSLNSSLPTTGADLESVATAAGDSFGSSISISERRAVIGAPGDDEGALDAGAAYVFEHDSDHWRFVQKLVAPDPRAEDAFGFALTIDGDELIVGAPGRDGALQGQGEAYVYEWDGELWTLRSALPNPDATLNAKFGSSLALAQGRAFVGAPGDVGGVVHAFERIDGVLQHAETLTGSDTSSGDVFGNVLDFDGTTLVVGAQGANSAGAWSGAAYVFVEREGHFLEEERLSAFDASTSQFYGVDVAVAGELIAVGARGDMAGAFGSGAVYTYKGSGNQWTLERKLKSNTILSSAHFGSALALQGETLVVGARWDSTLISNGGAAYIFTRDGGTWPQVAQLLRPGNQFNDWFGAALELDRGELLIGSPRADDPQEDSGSVAAWRVAPGLSFCAGDGSAFDCSCANLGSAGRGCENSTGSGALLLADGTASLSARNLRFSLSELPLARPAVLFAAADQRDGGQGFPFGDGLLCLDGTLTRLRVGLSDAAGELQWTLDDLDKGQFASGQTVYFQSWYRDDSSGPCATGFNTSNGYVLTFDS